MEEFTTETKWCPGCKTEKPVDQFGICRGKWDGRQSYCRACRAQYKRNHADEIREKRQLDYKEHREEHLEKHREYYQVHGKEIRQRMNGYYESHRDERLEYAEEYRRVHKEQIREYHAQYIQTPHGRAAISRRAQSRRDREHHAPNDLVAEEWELILWLQGYICPSCEREFGDTLVASKDHVVPVKDGGGLTFWNVQALCRSCNSKKHDKHIDYRWWAQMTWDEIMGVWDYYHDNLSA